MIKLKGEREGELKAMIAIQLVPSISVLITNVSRVKYNAY